MGACSIIGVLQPVLNCLDRLKAFRKAFVGRLALQIASSTVEDVRAFVDMIIRNCRCPRRAVQFPAVRTLTRTTHLSYQTLQVDKFTG